MNCLDSDRRRAITRRMLEFGTTRCGSGDRRGFRRRCGRGSGRLPGRCCGLESRERRPWRRARGCGACGRLDVGADDAAVGSGALHACTRSIPASLRPDDAPAARRTRRRARRWRPAGAAELVRRTQRPRVPAPSRLGRDRKPRTAAASTWRCRCGRSGAGRVRHRLAARSTRMAIGALTCTPSVPSPTRMRPSTPSSTASTSIVALSVSISAITSPDDDRVALLLQPARQRALGHGRRQRRHQDVGRTCGAAAQTSFFTGVHHPVRLRQRQLLQVGGIGQRHVQPVHPHRRRVQPVERSAR